MIAKLFMSSVLCDYTFLNALSPQDVLWEATRCSLIAVIVGVVLAPLTSTPYLLPSATLYLTFTSPLIGDALWCNIRKHGEVAGKILQLIPLQSYRGLTLIAYSIQLLIINHLGRSPSVGYLGPTICAAVTYMIEGYFRPIPK